MAYLGICITVLFTAVAQILIKREIDLSLAARKADAPLLPTLWAIMTNPIVIGGFALAGVAAAGWIVTMMKMPYNTAYPIIIGLMSTLPIIGSLILGESLSATKLAAIAMVFGGIFLLATQR